MEALKNSVSGSCNCLLHNVEPYKLLIGAAEVHTSICC